MIKAKLKKKVRAILNFSFLMSFQNFNPILFIQECSLILFILMMYLLKMMSGSFTHLFLT